MRILLAFLLLFLSSSAWGQSNVIVNYQGATGVPVQASAANPLPVNASVSASISGFAPGGNFAHFTSTGSSADSALPTGAVVVAFNTGTTAVSCNLTIGAGSATANETVIEPSAWFAFTVGSNTHISCINQAGDSASNAVVLSGGTGLPTGASNDAGSLATANGYLSTIVTNTGSPVPLGTASGITPLKLNALSNSAVAIKASAGQLFLLQCGNTNASEEYVQIYNVASGSVTVGTTAPTLSIPIAAASTGGFALSLVGLQFSTAISVAATTTATGGTAPGTALDCNAGYN